MIVKWHSTCDGRQTPTYCTNLECGSLVVFLWTIFRLLWSFASLFSLNASNKGTVVCTTELLRLFLHLFINLWEKRDIFNWIFCLVLSSIVSSYFPFWYTVYFVVRSVCFVACHCVYFFWNGVEFIQREKKTMKKTTKPLEFSVLSKDIQGFPSTLSKVTSTRELFISKQIVQTVTPIQDIIPQTQKSNCTFLPETYKLEPLCSQTHKSIL